MGLFSTPDPKAKAKAKRDLERYREADRRLQRLAEREKRAGIRRETPAFHRANARVLEAQKNVPWWRR